MWSVFGARGVCFDYHIGRKLEKRPATPSIQMHSPPTKFVFGLRRKSDVASKWPNLAKAWCFRFCRRATTGFMIFVNTLEPTARPKGRHAHSRRESFHRNRRHCLQSSRNLGLRLLGLPCVRGPLSRPLFSRILSTKTAKVLIINAISHKFYVFYFIV